MQNIKQEPMQDVMNICKMCVSVATSPSVEELQSSVLILALH
jgi:hypothetical protein